MNMQSASSIWSNLLSNVNIIEIVRNWVRIIEILGLRPSNSLPVSYYILIIECSSVVNVVEWLDGSFDSQSRLEKAQQWFDTRKSLNMLNTFLSLKQ